MNRLVVIALFLLLLAAVPCGLVWRNYRRDIARARERVASGSAIAHTPCGSIEYASAGDGPPVLIVHGAGGGYDQGLDFAAPLAQHGFRVIAMSRFGYLRTPLPADASAAAQADAHACLLDALGIRGAAIIGASAGAPSAMQLALRHPDRCNALILLVPAAYAPRAGRGPSLQTPRGTEFLFATALKHDFLFWAAPRIARSNVIRAILATPPDVVANASTEERARVEDVIAHILPVSARRLGLLNDAAIVSSLRRYDLEHIRTPTLAISMADDLYGTCDAARYSAAHIPGARFVPYPDGGHLWVGHAQDVMTEIAGFLKSSGAAAAAAR